MRITLRHWGRGEGKTYSLKEICRYHTGTKLVIVPTASCIATRWKWASKLHSIRLVTLNQLLAGRVKGLHFDMVFVDDVDMLDEKLFEDTTLIKILTPYLKSEAIVARPYMMFTFTEHEKALRIIYGVKKKKSKKVR